MMSSYRAYVVKSSTFYIYIRRERLKINCFPTNRRKGKIDDANDVLGTSGCGINKYTADRFRAHVILFAIAHGIDCRQFLQTITGHAPTICDF